MNVLEETLSSDEPYQPSRPPWRALAMAASLIVLLVLAIFLPPLINLGKYRRSITASMSEALGRPVYVGQMQLRLLPMPGIVMSDLTVDEDPAFGYEPALHAASVVASLRLSSLWRGRLEVSRISLDDANVNLVKNASGQWSIGSVLLRASQIPNAPTGERHASAHPRFPYIEATNARIDFKDGVEKKPFSLMSAEFSMWQPNGDEWRLRLEAQPVRTDLQLHLSDTGQLTVEGSLGRAAELNAMPVNLEAEWSGAQLGQVSRLVAGVDSGWRGDLRVASTVRGTVGDLNVQSHVTIGDLRRQEFQPLTAAQVDANCRSEYHRAQRLMDNITCFWPVGSGHLLMTGRVQGFISPNADLQLEINQIPASFPVMMLGLMRPHAQNVTVTGTVNGGFHLTSAGRRVLSGDAVATGVSLHYSGGTVVLPAMHFAVPAPPAPPPHKAQRAAPVAPAHIPNTLQLQAIAIPLGEVEPLVVNAQFSRAGFDIHLGGQAALGRLIPAAANLGVLENAVTVVAPKGGATVDVETAGAWMRALSDTSSGIGTTGTIKVEDAELRPGFLPAPVEVQSAEIDLTPEEISWENVVLHYQTMVLRGSIRFPATCNQQVACPATFTLNADALDAAAVESALGAGNGGFFGQLITNALGGGGTGWPSLRGQMQSATFRLGQLELRDFNSTLSVEGTTLTLSSLDADALGGKLHAEGEMKMQDGSPRWHLNLHVADASANEVASLFNEKWGPGSMTGGASLTMNGYRTEDLASSAAGDFSFSWENGTLPATQGPSETALEHFDRWTGRGAIAKGELTVASGGITHGSRSSAVRGTISFDRDLDLTLETRRGRVKISGTLAQPVVQ